MGFERTLLFEIETCYKCSCVFAMLAEQMRSLREKGGSFWCPNGHSQHYRESEVQKLRRRLEQSQDRERSNREWAEATERSLAATKGVVTRIKRRVGNGVCPCCHRTFKQLVEHMKRKHPDYREEPAA